MPFTLGQKSTSELQGVHPKLVKVVERAIEITAQDFSVHDGLRTPVEQKAFVAAGTSQTLNSLHLKQPDGLGHAVDLVPFIAGKLQWHWPAIYKIAAAMRQAAEELDADLVWGGVWDKRLRDLGTTAADMENAVAGYVSRRKAMGKKAFIDGPHYQI